MKYAIIECINGNYFVRADGITSLESAKIQYHGRCQALWNASDVINAVVKIVDENLDCVDSYREFIHHEVVQE